MFVFDASKRDWSKELLVDECIENLFFYFVSNPNIVRRGDFSENEEKKLEAILWKFCSLSQNLHGWSTNEFVKVR